MGLDVPSSAPACDHDPSKGFMEYTLERVTWWSRLLHLHLSERYVYCMACHMTFKRLFEGYQTGRLSLAQVEAGLRAMGIHESEKEIRTVIRNLRREPHAAAA